MSGEIPEAVHDPWPKLRAEWDAHEAKMMEAAANDPLVQALAGLLPHCRGAVTPGLLIDTLQGYVEKNYVDIRPDLYSELFMAAADNFMQREIEGANGEA